MARTSLMTGLLVITGVWLGTVVGPAAVYAGGCYPTVYDSYGDTVYYTTRGYGSGIHHDVRYAAYAPGRVYVPANYPADFVYPQAAPAAYGVVYREPVYGAPVYPSPVYYEPVYVAPRPSVFVGIGGAFGYRQAYGYRSVHVARETGHRSARISYSPRGYARPSAGYGFRAHSYPSHGRVHGGYRHRR